MAHRYLAAPGAGFADEDAEVIGARVLALRQQGALTPERVVDDARPEESPTHRYFEWNDAVAAEKYRVSQATHYLSHIFVVAAPEGEPLRVDALVQAPAGTRARVGAVAAEVKGPAEILREARAELGHWQERYRGCQQLRPAAQLVLEAIEALEEIEERTRQRVTR